MNDKVRYFILSLLFMMMGFLVCLKIDFASGCVEGMIGIGSVIVGIYYFYLMRKQRS